MGKLLRKLSTTNATNGHEQKIYLCISCDSLFNKKIVIMTQERKRQLGSFFWKLITAIIAALSGSLGVSAATHMVVTGM